MASSTYTLETFHLTVELKPTQEAEPARPPPSAPPLQEAPPPPTRRPAR
uniref:Uncharacterized protein n=1 Tax=Arundo donax TaxID=35708 RepID=A0A0A9TUQ6_ARUDO